MEEARALLRAAGGHGLLVAKIERAEAIKNLTAVVKASDGVMVARGDLGVEMGYAELAGLQKLIIQEARHQNRVVIMATQMMESMITNTIPTRAEVSDVANAVMDGTDAVMLSAETASGKHPIKVVEAMAQIIVGAEKYQLAHVRIRQRDAGYFEHTDEAIAAAVILWSTSERSIFRYSAAARPLLVKGEPGTGKTVLAEEIAAQGAGHR
jgi:pyruvate kinase